uniref:Uncharacterized protein n=1 Tax=Aegilops tauschii subsp. strangulata TaxID=200361 RepID=A0A453B6Z7_AEGTS
MAMEMGRSWQELGVVDTIYEDDHEEEDEEEETEDCFNSPTMSSSAPTSASCSPAAPSASSSLPPALRTAVQGWVAGEWIAQAGRDRACPRTLLPSAQGPDHVGEQLPEAAAVGVQRHRRGPTGRPHGRRVRRRRGFLLRRRLGAVAGQPRRGVGGRGLAGADRGGRAGTPRRGLLLRGSGHGPRPRRGSAAVVRGVPRRRGRRGRRGAARAVPGDARGFRRRRQQ